MQFVIGLFGALTGGGGAAAGAAGAAAGAAGAAATGASVLGTILQGGATLLGALGAINSANAQADALDLQAGDQKIASIQEDTAGIQRRDSLRRQLYATLGENDVAYAASGLDLSFGTAQTARQQAVADADRAISGDAGDVAAKQARLAARADQLRRMARDQRSAGMLAALGGALDFGTDVVMRG